MFGVLSTDQQPQVVRHCLTLAFSEGPDHFQFLVTHQDFQLVRAFRRHVLDMYLNSTSEASSNIRRPCMPCRYFFEPAQKGVIWLGTLVELAE